MNQYNERKRCPLKEVDPDLPRNTECREDRCAWWMAHERCCAIRMIAQNLSYVEAAVRDKAP